MSDNSSKFLLFWYLCVTQIEETDYPFEMAKVTFVLFYLIPSSLFYIVDV